MNYKRKRVKSGLSTYTIAKELGIDWKKYQEVEENKIALEGENLNKFLNITEYKNAKMIKFNRRQKINDIKNFINDGKMKELMAKRGYNGMTLASVLGVDSNVIKRVLDGKEASEDMNEYVYDFLQDSLNANTEVEKTDIEEETEKEISLEEIKRLKNEKSFGTQELSNAVDIPISTLSHILAGRNTKQENLQKIYDFLLNNEPKTRTELEKDRQELEKVLTKKKLSKMDVARTLGINYSYVYNFFKGVKIKKEFEDKITDYIMGVEGKKVKKNEPFELNLKEISEMIKDKGISYKEICKELRISYSYINKLLGDRIIGSFDTKRQLDEFVRNYVPNDIEETNENKIDEVVNEISSEEKTEDSDIDEKVIPETMLDEMLKEDIEEEFDEDSDEFIDDDEDIISIDYFEVLKENKELKTKLTKAERQIEMYETLIDVIKGQRNDN